MRYNELVRDYYNDLNNLTELLKKMTDSYRLLIGGAFELNNINEAKTRYVKAAVDRADKLGDTIDHLIDLIDHCGESYFEYCTNMNDYILKTKNSSDSNNEKIILTEVDDELLFKNSNIEADQNINKFPKPN